MTFSSRQRVQRTGRRDGARLSDPRTVAEETPVAFSYGGSTHAVMMATPNDLIDFAYGFSLTEGIISRASDMESVEIVPAGPGVDVQVMLAIDAADALSRRRRHLAGPVGCGLCGIESIEQALRPVTAVPPSDVMIAPFTIARAMRSLEGNQPLHQATRAVHGAGFFSLEDGSVTVREDIGRHNALDKLIGALVRAGTAPDSGVLVVTSRVSVEIVQKAAAFGSPLLLAVSAPTALAVSTAEEAGMTLLAVVRDDDFEVFTHPDRIKGESVGVA